MDGYSVNEAAAVLGIPEGRVWELLARGVLSGSAEVGGDMRVFLRETAVTPSPSRDGNGNGGSNGGHGELTPFRELLTEFRNLTERYGQALLALGEARGEVATLRGRVDLLEARLDHRLPWTEAPSAWAPSPETAPEAELETPPRAEREREEPVPAQGLSEPSTEPEPAPEPMSEDPVVEPPTSADFVADVLDATLGPPAETTTSDDTPPPPKPRPGARDRSREEAFSGFAEALARAQDPATETVAADTIAADTIAAETVAADTIAAETADIDELPGTRDTADAVAAYRRETETDADERPQEPVLAPARETAVEPAVEPETAPPADVVVEVPMSSIVRPGYSTDTPEPDWIAEEDLIISAGEDASVRAGELLHRAATAVAVSEPEASRGSDVAEPDDSSPEVLAPEAIAAETIAPETIAPETIEPEAAEPEPVAAVGVESEALEPALGEAADAAGFAPTDDPEPAVAWPEVPEPEPEPEPAAWPEVPEPEPEPAAWPEVPEPDAKTAASDVWNASDTTNAPDAWNESEVWNPDEEEAAETTKLTPVDISGEPPSPDDMALLVEPEPFLEPPIVPPEPAFWEPGAGSRAPFAIAQPDPWEASPARGLSIEVQGAAAAPSRAATSAPPIAAAAPVSPPEEPVAKLVAPVSTPDEPESTTPAAPSLSPAAQAGRAAAARRRPPQRGPAARAIRRLRLLLD